MSRAWIAILDAPAPDADAQAPLEELDGEPAGWLAAWLRQAKPVRAARRADPRLIHADGAPALPPAVLPDRQPGPRRGASGCRRRA